ncbi:glutamate receptor ionotropic, delta-2-like [Panulirus ornatus]|uniref:glutamate receptor ionotropic, delta-2-like n=1 Tax=Panulirus ornatus TaxID=150431 RepID=UPI003A862F66
MGHTFRVVSVPYVPYMDFEKHSDEPGATVTPKDSMDVRVLLTFAKALNFTFKVREAPNRSWGMEKDGIFDGAMGQLQREEMDFCTVSGPTPERLWVSQHIMAYPSDTMNVISLKPSPLPENLSLLRPLTAELWLALLGSALAYGVTLWLLQKTWWWLAGGHAVKFSVALQYSWGTLLEQPPSDPSINDSGRLLVGWWLMFCVVIDTCYRSSLIAHMTVQGKTRPPESFEDLVKQDGWKWCTEPWFLKGIPFEYLSQHNDPVVKQIYKEMEVLRADEALKKVLEGSYSLIDLENYISIIIDSRWADSFGNTPFYISKKGITMIASFGWSVRKGAPFYHRFGQLMFRLKDAGIITYWIDDVIATRVKKNRETIAEDPQPDLGDTLDVDSSNEVLGMRHLLVPFYLLVLGCTIASLTLMTEYLIHRFSKHPSTVVIDGRGIWKSWKKNESEAGLRYT